MNILIDIGHPGQVHLLRGLYYRLKSKGHKVVVTVKDIPAAVELLNIYGIEYIYLGKKYNSLLGKFVSQFLYNAKTFRIIKKHKIQIGAGSTLTLAQMTKLSKIKAIILDDDDDEVEPLFVKYGHPYANVVLSPKGTQRETPRYLPYSGYHELAYLHPNYFTPDKKVLTENRITENDIYFVLRFNAFKAHHDINERGLAIEQKRELIEYLETKGKVFITTEHNIDEEFKKYQLLISPDKIHSFIYYATMLIGDSQTMTSEAAVLGTPSIRCNSFVGRIHYLNEQEREYGLTYGFLPHDFPAMMQKIDELLSVENLKEVWAERRDKMLSDKIDVTDFLVWFIENYPDSEKIMRNNPDYQYNFK